MDNNGTPILSGGGSLSRIEIVSKDGSQTVDISDLLVRFELSESITTPYILGSLQLVDAVDLVNTFPMCGEETIEFEWTTNNDISREVKMNIVAIGGLTPNRNMTRRVVDISLISETGANDAGNFISISGNGNIADMANELFSNIGSNLDYVPTDGVIELCLPKKPIAANMRHLCAKAYSADDPTAIFVFFESAKGQHFLSMTELHRRAVANGYGPYTYNPSVLSSNNKALLETQIIDFSVAARNESNAQASAGRYGMTVGLASLQSKTWNTTEWDIRDNFDDANPFPTNFPQSDDFIDEKIQNKNTEWVLAFEDQLIDSIYPNRHAYSYWQTQSLVLININGNADITCGQGIELDIQKAMSNNNEIQRDDTISGNWLIRSANHVFDKKSYTIGLECGRIGT